MDKFIGDHWMFWVAFWAFMVLVGHLVCGGKRRG